MLKATFIYWTPVAIYCQKKTVSNGEFLEYKIPYASTSNARNYFVHYGSTEKAAWIPSMFFIPYRDYGPVAPLNFTQTDTDPEYFYGDKIYFKQKKSSSNNIKHKYSEINNYYTMDELYMEFYDGEENLLTNQAKNLDVGDIVKIKDNIVSIEYLPTIDATKFKFKSSFSNVDFHEVLFKNNLISQYNVDESIDLAFDVVRLLSHENNEFIDLNYNVIFDSTGEIPYIDLYVQ